MFWDNFLVDRTLTEVEIVRGVVALFGVEQEQVFVLQNIMEQSDAVAASLVIVIPCFAQGDFVERFDLYLFGDVEKSWVGEEAGAALCHAQALSAFCQTVSCRCLIPGETPSPTEWFHVNAHGFEQVTIDGNKLEDEFYCITKPTTACIEPGLAAAGAR